MESLPRPVHRRKLSNANGVFSFSSKNAYDDVLAAGVPPASAAAVAAKTKFKAPVGVEEYGEIFGGGSRRGSSIPVLDLSALDDERKTGSEDHRSWSKKQLDYAKIFGGFGDEDIAVPYEELVAENSKKCSSDKAAMNQSAKESPVQGPDNCRLGHLCEAPDQSLDGVKQVNMSYHKSSPRSNDGTSGTTHIAKLQVVPGFTYFIDETARQQKTEGDRSGPKIKTEVQRTWSFSGNLHEENNGKKSNVPLPNKLTSEGVIKGKHGSRSNDKLFYSGEINPKSHSFRSSPTSSPPAKQNDSKDNPKRSKSSSFAFEANAFDKASDYLTGSSDEELDMNSAAAASAAALKKAVEQAQESIRLAKELMERKKNGFQAYSRPSAKGRNEKESRIEREANNSKENNKETYVRFDNVLQEFTGRNSRTALPRDEVATTSEHTENFSASRKVEVEKHKQDVKIQAETMFHSNLGNNGNHRTTSASGQIESKNTISNKQAGDHGDLKISAEVSECIKSDAEKTKAVEQDLGLGNAENRTNVHSEPQESEETIKNSVSTRIHNYGTSDDLRTTQEDILTEDMRNSFDGGEECENKLQECLDIIREEKLEPCRLEDMQKESPKVVEEEKASQETIQEHLRTAPEDLHVKENDSGLGNSSNQGGGVLQEAACQFVEKDDMPIAVSGGSCEKAHVDTVEGEDNERSYLIQERDIDEMVAICGSNMEETQRISNSKLKEEEVEELDLKQVEPIDARDGDKSKMILKEGYEGEEALRSHRETCNHVEANLKIPKEEFEQEKVEKRFKEDYVTEAHEGLWMETGKSIEHQKVEVMREAEEVEGVHFLADKCAKNHEIGFLQKAACERKTELQVQEANRFEISDENVKTSLDAVENHEDACNTAEANEALNQCERDTDKAEARVKEIPKMEREVSEAADCVQSAYQEHIIPDDMQSDCGTVDSDGNGANIHCDQIDQAHKFVKENTFETADLVQGALKENDRSIKMEASETHLCDEKAMGTASSVNCSKKGIEENVEEGLSFNPEIGGGLVVRSGKTSKIIQEADLSNDKGGKTHDVDLVTKQSNTGYDSREAKSIPLVGPSTTYQVPMETYKEMKRVQNMQHAEDYLSKAGAMDWKEMSETKEKDDTRKIEANKKERERNTDRIAVERVIREARERAFAEARERAERAAVERAAAEVRQRVMTEAREKLEKATTGTKLANKASIEAKLRAERAAVERATTEARQRAFEKARSQKLTAEARVQVEMSSGASRDNELKHSLSASDSERMEGGSESAQRRKARLERHHRIMERAAKALEEKNMRDLLAQKEQAERNRLAEYLDADIKRWANGKEGNLRALLSTLQYILGPNSGWQPISLTEIITTVAVKKAYRKATLYVHPDKLQQRGASIQQKYICEKIFDLLKAAWNRFNSEER